MTPNEQELRELDAWLAHNVMRWSRDFEYKNFKPTTDSAAAMEVLNKCLIECAEIQLSEIAGRYLVESNGRRITENEPTLELAIAKFAKLLFSK